MDDHRLNQLLDMHRTPAPSASLRERILAAAPQAPSRRSFDLFWWASSAGLAAAGMAGVLLGSTLAPADSSVESLLAEAEPYDLSTLVSDDGEGAL